MLGSRARANHEALGLNNGVNAADGHPSRDVLLLGGDRNKSSEHALRRSVGHPVSLGHRLAGHSAIVDIQSVSQMRVFE